MFSRIALASTSLLAMPLPAISLEHVMNDVLAVESAFVSKFLPYRAMTRIPPAYEEFARWHFQRLDDGSLRWQDVAPAYALACLSHAAYGSTLDPSIEWELELQWADLQDLSAMEWPTARRVIMAAWAFLTGGSDLPENLDAAIDNGIVSPLDASGDGEDGLDEWIESELVPAYVVLRESMAAKSPEDWRTRGQEHWLSSAEPVLCLAMSPALAALEAVTQQGFHDEESRFLVRLAFPPSMLRVLSAPTSEPDVARHRLTDRRGSTRRGGEQWARERQSALLQVPSPLCPGEFNVLANIRHPDFARLARIDARPLNMDRRRRNH